MTEEDVIEERRKKEESKKRKDIELFRKLQKKGNIDLEGYGGFFFVVKDERFDGIKPETVTKLIMLSTYLKCGENKLMYTQRTPMKREHIGKVLQISPSTVTRFLRETKDYVAETENGIILSNGGAIVRGHIKDKQHEKFYVDGVRALYNKAEKQDHRRIGCLFKLLPFINIEWNLLCYPEYTLERDITKIELLPLTEFCELIDFDIKHISTLLESYRSIRFKVGDRMERFCSIDSDGLDKRNAKIVVNPHILYSGSDYKKVEAFAALCR